MKRDADKKLGRQRYEEAVGMYAHILQLMVVSRADMMDMADLLCKKAECHLKLVGREGLLYGAYMTN